MNKYPIFYVIHGQFFETENSKETEAKTVSFIFKNKSPKKLRKLALSKFLELTSKFLIKAKVSAPTYPLIRDVREVCPKDSIVHVPFFTKNIKLNLALTLSMGIKTKTASSCALFKYVYYPYNKNLYPIMAVGMSLPEVENCLKVNLLLEKYYYEKFSANLPKINKVPNFIEKEVLQEHIINNLLLEKEIDSKDETYYLNEILDNNEMSIFPTNQFYNTNLTITKAREDESLSFINQYKRKIKNEGLDKLAVLKKEIELLSVFIETDENVNLLDADHSALFRLFNSSLDFRQCLFSKKQLEYHDEIIELFFQRHRPVGSARELLIKYL